MAIRSLMFAAPFAASSGLAARRAMGTTCQSRFATRWGRLPYGRRSLRRPLLWRIVEPLGDSFPVAVRCEPPAERSALVWTIPDLYRLHGGQDFGQGHGGEAGGVIGEAVGDDQLALVEEEAAGVDDVRHVALPLRCIRLE